MKPLFQCCGTVTIYSSFGSDLRKVSVPRFCIPFYVLSGSNSGSGTGSGSPTLLSLLYDQKRNTAQQCCGSGSAWIHIGLAPWIQIRICIEIKKNGSGSTTLPARTNLLSQCVCTFLLQLSSRHKNGLFRTFLTVLRGEGGGGRCFGSPRWPFYKNLSTLEA
jgi:hypothetical protein